MNILASILNFIYTLDELRVRIEAGIWNFIYCGEKVVYETGKVSGCDVYFHRFGIFFEYLLVIDGKIYTFGQNIKPRTLQAIKHLFLGKKLYSDNELSKIIAFLKMQAGATIENHVK